MTAPADKAGTGRPGKDSKVVALRPGLATAAPATRLARELEEELLRPRPWLAFAADLERRFAVDALAARSR